jgi:ferredoxin--NADP+ reductase
LQDGSLYRHLDIDALDPEHDRVMICGSMAMLKDVRTLVEAAGFVEGANNKPGSFVVERAFVG